MESNVSRNGGKGSGQIGVSASLPYPSYPLAVCGKWAATESTLFGLRDLVPVVCPHLAAKLDLCFGSANLSDRAGHQKNHGCEDGVS